MTKVNVRALVELVIDGRTPDGELATDDDIAAAIHLAFDHDEQLCELLCQTKLGRRINGDRVDWDQREQALTELERFIAGPWERSVSPVGDDDDGVDKIAEAEDLFEEAETGHRAARRALAEHHLGHGRALKSEPRRQVDVQALLEKASRELGYESEELLRPVPRGRLREDERLRRDALAHAVDRARAGGATLDAIGAVIGIPKQRVSDLADRGRMLETP